MARSLAIAPGSVGSDEQFACETAISGSLPVPQLNVLTFELIA